MRRKAFQSYGNRVRAYSVRNGMRTGNSSVDEMVILVVDDDPLVRMQAANVLTDAGFEVLEADSADEGIELLDHDRTIGAVVSDIETPGRYDGFALAWHACMKDPATPVLLISGRTMAADDELPWGARFLEKPVDPDQLVHALREVLRAARASSH